jgi:hypothetical protein
MAAMIAKTLFLPKSSSSALDNGKDPTPYGRLCYQLWACHGSPPGKTMGSGLNLVLVMTGYRRQARQVRQARQARQVRS